MYTEDKSQEKFERVQGARKVQTSKTLPTTQHLADVARSYLTDLEIRMQQSSSEILHIWPTVAGEFAKMTRVKKFENGVLYVGVSNSLALSLLHQKKSFLLAALRAKVPGVQVIDIMFRFG